MTTANEKAPDSPLVATTAEPVTPADLVSPLGERMPPVTDGQTGSPAPSVTESNPVTATAPDPHEGKRDARNTKFSRERHQVNEDGSPKVNRRGNFMLRTDYRNAHASAGEGGSPSPAQPREPSFNTPTGTATKIPAEGEMPLQDEYDAAAEIYLQSAYGPIIIGFSEHARPNKEEHTALKTAVANYLRVKQITEPSPGWALMFTVAAVAVKKSEHPEVRERAKTLWERISSKFKPAKI